MIRQRIVSLLLVLSLVLGGAAAALRPASANAATTLEVCGKVSLYLKPTALLPGALTIGGVPVVLAAGTSVPASVAVGANICIEATIGGSGSVVSLTVSANASVQVKI